MRGIFIRIFAALAVLVGMMCLTSCTREIRGPSDELRMFRWRCEEENGCAAALSFGDTDACLTIDNDAYSLSIEGLCAVDDHSMTICDSESGKNYSFGYLLYGDRIVLRYGTGELTLDKTE